MNPKKPKDIIKPTADILELSEILVEDVTNFYWSTVRKALSEIESPSITVFNLGIFNARYKKIPLLEKKYKAYLDNLEIEQMTFNKHTIQNTSKHKLDRLAKLKIDMEVEYARKEEVRIKRQNYVNSKNLEE